MPPSGGDVTITAVFGPKPDQRTLKLQVTGPGSIWSADVQCSNFYNCANGGHYYPLGDIVRLDPLPDLGAKLVRWTGCPAPSDTACFLTMTEDRVVGAEFVIDAGARTLEVGVREDCGPRCVSSGAGSVSSADGGIRDCDAESEPCRHSYPLGTVVHLTATLRPGTTFLGWTDCPSPSGTTCDVPMTEARTVVAAFHFEIPPPPAPAWELLVEPSGFGAWGLIALDAGGAGNPDFCSWPRIAGVDAPCRTGFQSDVKSVHLIARPQDGTRFVGWDGDCTGSSTECTVSAPDAGGPALRTVRAEFAPVVPANTVSLSVLGAGATGFVVTTITGTDPSSGGGSYQCRLVNGAQSGICQLASSNGTVSLTAYPVQPGNVFVEWSGACAGTDPHCFIPFTRGGETAEVTATFARSN